MVLAALAEIPGNAASATEIRSTIYRLFGADIERTSLSPQLSRLRGERRIERMGKVWMLLEGDPDQVMFGLTEPESVEDISFANAPSSRLGRGLSALLGDYAAEKQEHANGDASDLVHVRVGARK